MSATVRPDIGYTPRMRQQRGSIAKLFWALVLCGALVYAVVVVLDPWSVHMGGRSTPLLIWHGAGTLRQCYRLLITRMLRVQ